MSFRPSPPLTFPSVMCSELAHLGYPCRGKSRWVSLFRCPHGPVRPSRWHVPDCRKLVMVADHRLGEYSDYLGSGSLRTTEYVCSSTETSQASSSQGGISNTISGTSHVERLHSLNLSIPCRSVSKSPAQSRSSTWNGSGSSGALAYYQIVNHVSSNRSR